MGSQFLVRSSMDALQQGLVKGDFRKVDFFDAGITGFGYKPQITDFGKTVVDFSIDRGFRVKTNPLDIGVEYGLRSIGSSYLKGSGNAYGDLGAGITKKYFIGQSMGVYRDIKLDLGR
ncbi:MAG: hypothetical protein H0X62_07715 [Bacteroidetes bacterium]|nr:hypothetical protein [Bacteroidota bacterium]